MAAAWRTELAKLEDGEQRRRLTARLGEFMRCGQKVLVRQCGGCGDDRDESGTFIGTRTCKSKACATCAWVRARGIGEGLERAFELVESMPGYQWQFAVVSLRWDPSDPEELEVAGLRGRAMAARRVGKALWAKALKKPAAGLLRSIEVSARGYVHINLVYYGPPMDADQLREVGGAVDCRVGRVHVQALDTDPTPAGRERVKVEDPRGSKRAVKRAAEYASKGHERTKGATAWDEGWLAGDRTAKVIDPHLAARWEIATYKLHLLERYGAFRGMEIESSPRQREEPGDHETACQRCGTVGDWRWSWRGTEEWLQHCHDRGRAGLRKSSWQPPARDGPNYHR